MCNKYNDIKTKQIASKHYFEYIFVYLEYTQFSKRQLGNNFNFINY